MYKPKILWFGMFSEDVKKIMIKNLPIGFEIMFVKSKDDKEEHIQLLTEAEYISPNGINLTEDYLRAAKKLKLIQLWGSGTDAYNLDLLKELNIGLQNGVGLNAAAVAELAVLHMLAISRKLVYVDSALRQGKWLKTEMRDKGNSIYGKTIGLLGLGTIGQKVAQIIQGFGVKEIIYYDICRMPEKEKSLKVKYMELDKMIRNVDILSLHMPLTASTYKLINKKRISLMKEEAIIINTARGGIIDEAALIDALQNGRIRGAGLDTFDPEPPRQDNPLFKMDNVVLSSHIGGAVIENVEPRILHVYDCIAKHEKNIEINPKFIILKRQNDR